MDITPGQEKSSQNDEETYYQYILVSKKKIEKSEHISIIGELIDDQIVNFGQNILENKITEKNEEIQIMEQKSKDLDIQDIQKKLDEQQFQTFKEIREKIDDLAKQLNEETQLSNLQILSTLECFQFNSENAYDLSKQNLEILANDKKEIEKIQQEYGEEEFAKIKKFKIYVEEKNLARYFDTQYLIRFLKGRDWEIEDAIEMFELFLKWRENNDVEQIQNLDFSQEIQQLREIFPHAYHNTDINGRPLYVEILSGLKYDDMIKQDENSENGIMTKERIEKYFIKEFENLVNQIFPKCSQIQGKNINQMVRIIDMKNYKLKPDQIKSFLNLTQGILQDNYPEILGRMYLINVNMTFKLMWKGVKLILPKTTQKKIEVLGKDYKEEILKIVKEEDLPVQLGGTCDKCDGKCLTKNIGEWEKSD